MPYVTSTVEEVRHRLRDKSSAINDLNSDSDIAIGLTDKAIAQKEHILIAVRKIDFQICSANY
jgi:hypothetical protein